MKDHPSPNRDISMKLFIPLIILENALCHQVAFAAVILPCFWSLIFADNIKKLWGK